MTYGRPKTLTKQAIFDKVARHLLTQGEKAMLIDSSGTERCRYRGPNESACAAGCLITDKEAEEADTHPNSITDGSPPWTQIRLYPSLADLLPFEELIYDLQKVHDKKDVSEWVSELIDVAKSHGLNPRTPEFWEANHV